jgi:adenylylsulfate kinase
MTGGVVLVTGLPSSGKSTFALQASAVLRERGVPACVLDGDAVRQCLVPAPGYDAASRRDFYETLARLGAELARQGLVVLLAATAHRRTFRDRARELAPRYVEVFVDTPFEECARRDTKGLYAAGRRAAAHDVPGLDAEYERPDAPDVVVHPGELARALDLLFEKLGVFAHDAR